MHLPPLRDLGQSLLRRAKPYALPLVISSVLAQFAIRKILEDAGRPAMPLDDSFIHFVYARRFVEGHPFTFGLGDGYSSGATSFVWPLLLTPFYAIGMRGLSLVYAVWGLGTLLHAATAVETKRLAEGLAGKAAAVGAAACCLLFGAFAWFSWSGMETMMLTWAMARTARVASEWCEAAPADRTSGKAASVGAMAALTSLIRPEGGVIGLLAGAALVLYARPTTTVVEKLRARWAAILPVLAVAWVPALNLIMVGHARSTTAIVKWAVGNPYYQGDRLWSVIGGNIHMLYAEDGLLAGGAYTAIFLPEHSQYVIFAGAAALLLGTRQREKIPRAVLAGAIALGTLIPCTFLTILWNRVRYIWPFAPGWFVLVACLGNELAGLVKTFTKRDAQWVAALVTGLFAGSLSTKLTWAIKDLANSSRAISEQQVKLGMWAEKSLPADARIGVNDTGAIAYFSERKTFDVVGLTTEGEARYWVAGPGSRFEHYEKMPRERLPTHFIVYPGWMGMPAVLGEQLTEATVTNQSILGGATKTAYVAQWDVLGKADRPRMRDRPSDPQDELDVSDLESEAAHAYLVGGTNENENKVTTTWDDEGNEVAEGGRHRRLMDRFELSFDGATKPMLVARLAAPEDIDLEISVGTNKVATIHVPETGWAEVDVALPVVTGRQLVTVAAVRGQLSEVPPTPAEDGTVPPPGPKTFGSLHYWLFRE